MRLEEKGEFATQNHRSGVCTDNLSKSRITPLLKCKQNQQANNFGLEIQFQLSNKRIYSIREVMASTDSLKDLKQKANFSDLNTSLLFC